ncbi:hypothetical protein SAMN05216218_1533 [Halorientalis regularis]|jgi:hypothetical protein|uniref:Uncharacterized protein n=1 Tax=Halorientalis regularis TaxID=660518 RepID=A0A1G7UFC8_9EURY|nr:hypothetical protein SAMN05216218_1533 [Halorientalis regularis]
MGLPDFVRDHDCRPATPDRIIVRTCDTVGTPFGDAANELLGTKRTE